MLTSDLRMELTSMLHAWIDGYLYDRPGGRTKNLQALHNGGTALHHSRTKSVWRVNFNLREGNKSVLVCEFVCVTYPGFRVELHTRKKVEKKNAPPKRAGTFVVVNNYDGRKFRWQKGTATTFKCERDAVEWIDRRLQQNPRWAHRGPQVMTLRRFNALVKKGIVKPLPKVKQA